MLARITAVLTPWRKTILWLSGIVFCLDAINWWIFFYSPLDLPIRVSPFNSTKFNIPGGILLLIAIFTLLYFQKKMLRKSSAIDFITLVLASTVPLIIAESLFQLLRWLCLGDLPFLLRGIVVMTLFYLFISTIIAFIRKYHGTRLFAIALLVFVVAMAIIGQLFYS
jgi:FlaA1/EpsC-like NDP-sugar epimerase